MRDFVDDRTKDRWQSLLRLYTSGTTGRLQTMPKLDDRWSLGLWLGKSLASDEHYVGTSAGVRRCRSIWRRPEKQHWDRKMLTEMIGDPWNPTPQPRDKAPQVYITLERQIARRHERLFGMIRAGGGALAGMQGTTPGYCGQRSCTVSRCECKRTKC